MTALIPVAALAGHPRLATQPLIVVAFCAQWCSTCREFYPLLERIAAAHPDIVFSWADIEDDADLVGDIDVETFPTLALLRDGRILHFGASLPLEAVVKRLLHNTLRAGCEQAGVAPEVAEFAMTLRPIR
jgi:thioredoxin reductase (NADPH)